MGKIIRFLALFDRKIVLGIEKIAQKIQEYTGKTNFWLASRLLIVTVVIMLFAIFIEISQEQEKSGIGKALLINSLNIGSWLYATIGARLYLQEWSKDEEASFIRLAKGLANPRKIDPRDILLRLLLIYCTILFCSLLGLGPTTIFMVTAIIISIVLRACDPLPGNPNRMRDIFERLTQKFVGEATEKA